MTLAFIIAFFVIILDQITKFLVVSNMHYKETIPLLKDIFHLTYIENQGGGFSILEGKKLFFILSTLILISLLIFVLIKYKPILFDRISIGFIIGGGFGNLIDRFIRNGVVDFFDFRLINFPIFNVADCFVCIGVAMLIISTIFMKKSLFNKIDNLFESNKKGKFSSDNNLNED